MIHATASKTCADPTVLLWGVADREETGTATRGGISYTRSPARRYRRALRGVFLFVPDDSNARIRGLSGDDV